MLCDAIILARGGSKGIPGKNITDLAGRPLIAWTIEAALVAGCVRDVIVSTDSKQIAEVAVSCGAHVPMLRPDEIAGDLSPSEAALEHALRHMCRAPAPDWFLFPQVTSPIRNAGLFDRAFDDCVRHGYDSMFSATRIRNFIWKGRSPSEPMYDPQRRPMRQQLLESERFFRENGNFYLAGTQGFLKSGCRLFGRIGLFETDEDEALEIDEPNDLHLAAEVMRAKGLSSARS